MDEYVRLAKETIENYIKTGNDDFTIPEYATEEMQSDQAGTFVSIHKKSGELRGCIGTFASTQPNIALEIVANAISASTRDPRFPPITGDELDDLDISVDVLSTPEMVDSVNELDPKKYGVIVEKGMRRGLLLPDLDGVDTIEKQLEIASNKAGIYDGIYGCNIYRFTVTRHH